MAAACYSAGMASDTFVLYLRVSTDRQAASGLGIEAQRAAVTAFLGRGGARVVGEFVEAESGKSADRPKLIEALRTCRLYGARLLIAKLDRLSRDAHFLLGLEKAGVDFIAADMPNANRLTVGIMAMVAEEERRMISARTKAALAAAKARGTKLGGDRGTTVTAEARAQSARVRAARADQRAAELAPLIAEIRGEGATTPRQIAAALNLRGVPTAQGCTWSPIQVSRVLARIG